MKVDRFFQTVSMIHHRKGKTESEPIPFQQPFSVPFVQRFFIQVSEKVHVFLVLVIVLRVGIHIFCYVMHMCFPFVCDLCHSAVLSCCLLRTLHSFHMCFRILFRCRCLWRFDLLQGCFFHISFSLFVFGWFCFRQLCAALRTELGTGDNLCSTVRAVFFYSFVRRNTSARKAVACHRFPTSLCSV